MYKKKKMPFAFIAVFIVALLLAVLAINFLPVPSNWKGLLFFAVTIGVSFLGVWLVSVIKKGGKRR